MNVGDGQQKGRVDLLSTGSKDRQDGQATEGVAVLFPAPSPSSLGFAAAPGPGTAGGLAGPQPLQPPAWRRRRPPSCWLSSPGWCHPRGMKVRAGVVWAQRGSPGMAAGRVLLQTGGSLQGEREGGGALVQQCWGEHQCLWGMGCLWGCTVGYGEEWRGVLGGIQREAGNQPLHHTPACGSTAFLLIPCSRRGHQPADVCLDRTLRSKSPCS